MIALTATATERVREDIVAQLDLQEARRFLSSFNRANLTYNVQPKSAAFTVLLALLRKHQDEPAIVYCFSQKDTENLAGDLSGQWSTSAAVPRRARRLRAQGNPGEVYS